MLKSIELLQCQYLDLVLVHWPCQKHIEAYKAMQELFKGGQVKALGLSNYRVEVRVHALGPTVPLPTLSLYPRFWLWHVDGVSPTDPDPLTHWPLTADRV